MKTVAAALLACVMLSVFAGEDPAMAPLRAALADGRPAAIAAQMRTPFLFEGRAEDRQGLVQRVVPALFTPALRRCLQRAKPMPEGDGRRVLHCAPYDVYLEREAGRWRIAEFNADPES